MIPRISSSRMISNSSPSSLISEPLYLPKRTRSPFLTSSGCLVPSSLYLPKPAATTSPSWGFSLAVSGMIIPQRICSQNGGSKTIYPTKIRTKCVKSVGSGPGTAREGSLNLLVLGDPLRNGVSVNTQRLSGLGKVVFVSGEGLLDVELFELAHRF